MWFVFVQVESINGLLKGPVMTKACEETRHFYSDHNQPGTRSVQCVFVPYRVEAGDQTNTLWFYAEFRQTDDWTARCRCVIYKNIQEDPWNLPNSIKTLVESLQRFVDGELNILYLHLTLVT